MCSRLERKVTCWSHTRAWVCFFFPLHLPAALAFPNKSIHVEWSGFILKKGPRGFTFSNVRQGCIFSYYLRLNWCHYSVRLKIPTCIILYGRWGVYIFKWWNPYMTWHYFIFLIQWRSFLAQLEVLLFTPLNWSLHQCLLRPHPWMNSVLCTAFAKLKDHPHQPPPTPPHTPSLMTFNVMCRASWSGTEGSSSLDQLSPPPAILLPRSAQPSSALLLQLSLFLRHSSGAISLTRPAHFFPLLSSPTQPNPPPCLSLLHSVFAAFFPFFLFLNI